MSDVPQAVTPADAQTNAAVAIYQVLSRYPVFSAACSQERMREIAFDAAAEALGAAAPANPGRPCLPSPASGYRPTLTEPTPRS